MSDERKAELTPTVTPEMVVELYRKHNIPVDIGGMNVKGTLDRWDERDGLIRGGVYERAHKNEGCCGEGIVLIGRPVTKHSRDALRELGIDSYGFAQGFDHATMPPWPPEVEAHPTCGPATSSVEHASRHVSPPACPARRTSSDAT